MVVGEVVTDSLDWTSAPACRAPLSPLCPCPARPQQHAPRRSTRKYALALFLSEVPLGSLELVGLHGLLHLHLPGAHHHVGACKAGGVESGVGNGVGWGREGREGGSGRVSQAGGTRSTRCRLAALILMCSCSTQQAAQLMPSHTTSQQLHQPPKTRGAPSPIVSTFTPRSVVALTTLPSASIRVCWDRNSRVGLPGGGRCEMAVAAVQGGNRRRQAGGLRPASTQHSIESLPLLAVTSA